MAGWSGEGLCGWVARCLLLGTLALASAESFGEEMSPEQREELYGALARDVAALEQQGLNQ